MSRTATGGRRPAVHITLARAARLHRLVGALGGDGRSRDDLLALLGIGLRTYYRELELLRKCGVRVKLVAKHYTLVGPAAEAEGRLPFPDPQLNFAEMVELAAGPGPAARRLADLLARVTAAPAPKARRGRGGARKPAPGR